MTKPYLFALSLVVTTAVTGLLPAYPALAWRADLQTDWNLSPAPNALYGGCAPDDSAFAMKLNMLPEAGISLRDVLAIAVLECGPWYDSPYDWGAHVVPCPSGSPYSACIANGNDGLGNSILVGALKNDGKTSPWARVCSNGPTKLDLLIRAGEDPRVINGIVTVSCGAATGSGAVRRVDCPDGPSPYAYCLNTGNDGRGHAVTLGIVAANGPTDPLGLYGECGPSWETRAGFLRKSSLITAVGKTLGKVQGIELAGCAVPRSSGYTIPETLQEVACTSQWFGPATRGRYDYCIIGTDRLGNALTAGVITTK